MKKKKGEESEGGREGELGTREGGGEGRWEGRGREDGKEGEENSRRARGREIGSPWERE